MSEETHSNEGLSETTWSATCQKWAMTTFCSLEDLIIYKPLTAAVDCLKLFSDRWPQEGNREFRIKN